MSDPPLSAGQGGQDLLEAFGGAEVAFGGGGLLDAEVVPRLVARLTSVVRDGGVLLAMFHARKPEAFHRYRVLDAQNLELIPDSCPFAPQRVFQNREISNLFRRFHSSKTFVGRDQIREGLFIK